ncbi:MAG: thioether cross-link-forming SCIFF peptide maturase, partial [Ruminiclostridium sp.]|nr:thioether cross-link-forming SCIFF peptide maturase [Ruminiclostridium sp.]
IVDMLSSKYGRDKVDEAYDEIRELENDGQLYAEDPFSGYGHVSESEPVIKALCLHVAHDCNMRCRYCFAATGDFGIKRTLMSAETGKKAIDFIINASGGRRNLEIDFFGGEPLMNFEVIREVTAYTIEKGREYNKNFRLTLTTNALLLNEDHKKFINEHIGNLVMSIDGRKDVNDRMRFRVDGSGTYSAILPKIKDMADSRNQDRYYVRGTYTRMNTDFSKDVLHLADMGFKQISIEPVVAGKDSGYDIREGDLPGLLAEYEKLALEYVKRYKEGNGFNFFHFMIDLKQGPCAVKKLKGCGSGHEYAAVTPEGDIYPCHQFVGMDDFKMGNVNNGNGLNKEVINRFNVSNITSNDACRDCWAKFYCSGGCAANAYQFGGDLSKPYNIACELEKKRVECSLWIKTKEME